MTINSGWLKALGAASLGLSLSGCVALSPVDVGPAAKAAPSDLDRITYSISSCRGTCPAYTFFIAADGNSDFEGERHTSTTGRASVDGTPMLFKELGSRLAAIRPTGPDLAVSHNNCSVYSTDQQVVTVTWGWGHDKANVLDFDLGCRGPEHLETRKALSDVRRLLPIDGLVGRATEF